MLKELRVLNLGPVEQACITSEAPVTLILGPNECGKSTVLDALSVLYFGTRGNLAVAANAALTRAGAKGWKVEAIFDDGQILSATRSQRPKREELVTRFGDPRVFAALSEVEAFLDMDPPQRKQLLADLAASDTLGLAEDLQKRGVDEGIVKAVLAGNMRRAHTLATDLRRAEDRAIRQFSGLAEGKVEDTEVETKKGSLRISTVPLETVEDGIRRLSQRRDAIRSAGFKVEAYERAQRDAAAASEELAELTAEADWTAGDRSRVLELDEALSSLRTASGNAQIDIGNASRLDKELETLQATEGNCPTCKAPMNSKAAIAALADARASCAKRINDGQRLCKGNAEDLQPLEEERAALMKRKGEADTLSVTRARLEEKCRSASDVEEPEVPAGDVEKLSEEIARLQHMRDVRKEYDIHVRTQEQAQERVKKLAPKRDVLAALEKELDPSAIGDEEAILTEINGHLARTCGKLGVPVVLNDGYDISIHGRAPGLASDSARLRAGFGVACALSILSGVGLAFLDRFEALDDNNRKRVLGLLKGLVDDGLLSMVLIGAVKQTPVKVGNVPWLASVSIKNGIATYLEG